MDSVLGNHSVKGSTLEPVTSGRDCNLRGRRGRSNGTREAAQWRRLSDRAVTLGEGHSQLMTMPQGGSQRNKYPNLTLCLCLVVLLNGRMKPEAISQGILLSQPIKCSPEGHRAGWKGLEGGSGGPSRRYPV